MRSIVGPLWCEQLQVALASLLFRFGGLRGRRGVLCPGCRDGRALP
jgi:hypothetical protein